MYRRWLLIWLMVGAAWGVPGEIPAPLDLSGQAQAAPRNPQLNAEDELTPGQIERAQEPDRPAPATPSARKAAPKRSPGVACDGIFAKDSDHAKLADAFKPENVDFTDVDAGGGRTVKASVLFPSDPKRRVEVWWRDEAARSGIYLIDIGGQSTWTGPKGVRLGLPVTGLEKLNGKPFKLKGFDADGVATVTDWEKGAFDRLPGDCGLRVSLRPDPKAPAAARSAVANDLQEFASSDAVVRATRATVSEVLIGY